jgi:crotonobetainyl-CoA:carnitine CoA-transferase CaiB-like acyl-CoA transferase
MLPLEGVTVVAVEQAVAAPFASSRLADAGAGVVKVERPEGDFARGYDTAARGLSSYFVWLNRGKRSVSLDLRGDTGRRSLETLIAGADVLIQNLRPGALARLGFDPRRLERDYPRLVTCSITGFGERGPMADRKAYDLLIQAEAGLCSITGAPEAPGRVGISLVDIATGLTAYAAILEALSRRAATGRGARIAVSMFDVIADWLTVPLLAHESGRSPQRTGLSHPSIAPYGPFRAGDGRTILISIQSDREWRAFCAGVLRAPELGTDARFATNVARVENRSQTDRLVSAAFARLDGDELARVLQEAGIAFASVNDMAALSSHPHLRRIDVETANGPVTMPAPGARFAGETRSYGPVPDLPKGADTGAAG